MRLNCATPRVFNVSHIVLIYFYILGRLNFLSAMCLQRFHMNHFVKIWHILEEGDNLTTSVYWGRFLWWRCHTHEMLFEVTKISWRGAHMYEMLFEVMRSTCRHWLQDILKTNWWWKRCFDNQGLPTTRATHYYNNQEGLMLWHRKWYEMKLVRFWTTLSSSLHTVKSNLSHFVMLVRIRCFVLLWFCSDSHGGCVDGSVAFVIKFRQIVTVLSIYIVNSRSDDALELRNAKSI